MKSALSTTSAASLLPCPSGTSEEKYGGIVVIDVDRITTPRVMKEGVDEDVPKHQSVHVLSPKSTLIQPPPKKPSTKKGTSIATRTIGENNNDNNPLYGKWDDEVSFSIYLWKIYALLCSCVGHV